ncbi:protein kinase domain containing protein [Chrysochromulina tobinii]|uniref:Protein kinase domain containing protein n=1 Tax=Chrysochromulina tobinii TaxID=1460289 RepID=A0A0M0JQ55_9EUKA|nr:protein kinase domain containing protein [Chrysochromulina tobinii]|eukprot:KOO28383.1 protein kinase domain containing protein [Chrysochromulina sp. CCMP291]
MVGLDGSDLRLMEVAAGREHTLLLTAEGVVHSCGENSWAQLGQGSGHSSFDSRAPCAVLSPVAQLADQYIVQVAAGGNQSLALAATGELWAFGAPRHPTSLNEMRMRRVDAAGNAFVDPSGERIRIVHWNVHFSFSVAFRRPSSEQAAWPVPEEFEPD